VSPRVVRAVQAADLAAARVLLEQYLRIPGPLGQEWPEHLVAGALAADGMSDRLFLARLGGDAAGCAVLDLGDPGGPGQRGRGSADAELRRLYVAPGFRRRGVAQALVRELTRRAREHGCRRLALKVLAERDAARGLYTKLGFRPLGRHAVGDVVFEGYALELRAEPAQWTDAQGGLYGSGDT
jgi:ribosomal protein S18 acetylase RimI-like enzyme